MKLVVGLGNPGKEYENSRHNAGYMFIDDYVNNRKLKLKKRMNALYAEDTINGEKIIIIKPLTYMNLSGVAVKNYIDFYKININDVFVVYDDMSFDVGTFKIKSNGSSGGHNGIDNIMNVLHTNNINRMRIGISKNQYDMKDYVLSKFNKDEIKLLDNVITMSVDIISDFVTLPIERLMSKYNK